MTSPLVLGIETSCDETGAGLVRGQELLADSVASSVAEHARFGGVVPEVASRAHLEAMVATDARRRELYWARYAPDGARLAGPAVAVPAALPAGLPVAGEGAHLYPDLLGEALPPRYPSAATAALWCAGRLAAGEQLAPPDPMYLRRPDARAPGAPKSVLGGTPAGSGAVTP